ncbi:hypothetical protein SS50377_28343 [Spironucleus salmonicida]|uniref:Uncharacterized protein n=1 Tax=Spironucleus salmonicida TaxID=348837 RepID=V6LLK4_9EUKA|nr:hypothetical protein SS50377_28343 [Spironucleus salmonicida]|eukprot:EST45555.1 Hypothetical protein SS50377_14520 [Spironucleus salmonicida]
MSLDDLFQTADLDVQLDQDNQKNDDFMGLFMTADIVTQDTSTVKSQINDLNISKLKLSQLSAQPQPQVLQNSIQLVEKPRQYISTSTSHIITTIFNKTYYLTNQNQQQYIKSLINQLQNNQIPFQIPQTLILLQQLNFKIPFPSSLYSFHTENYKPKNITQFGKYLLQDTLFNKLQKQLYQYYSNNQQLQYYYLHLFQMLSFENLQSIVFVNVLNSEFDGNQLFADCSDEASVFYQVIIVPVVSQIDSLVISYKTLYRIAREHGFLDNFSFFIQLVQLFLVRNLSRFDNEQVYDLILSFTPELILLHVSKSQEFLQTSLIRRIYEENQPVQSVTGVFFIINQNYLSDGQYFMPYNSQIEFKKGQKILLSGCQKTGFDQQTEAGYFQLLDQNNYIIIKDNNVRCGDQYKLGQFKNPTFQCSLKELKLQQQFPHIEILIVEVFEDNSLVLGKIDESICVIDNQRGSIQYAGLYSCFVGTITKSQYYTNNNEQILQVQSRNLMLVKEQQSLKCNCVTELTLQVSQISGDESIGCTTKSKQYLLKGYVFKKPGLYKIRGLSMGTRDQGELLRVLYTKTCM